MLDVIADVARGLGADQGFMSLLSVFGAYLLILSLKHRDVQTKGQIVSGVVAGFACVVVSFVLTFIASTSEQYVIVGTILGAIMAGALSE